jgi:hypothetical protein
MSTNSLLYQNPKFIPNFSALHTPAVCRFCHISINGLVKLRIHYQNVHPMKKSSDKEESNTARCQTYHVCGQCDYRTNQVGHQRAVF